MSTTYGYDVQSVHDPCIVAAKRDISICAELLLPATSLVNIFHALKYIPTWFPGAVTQRKAAEVKTLTEEMKRIPMEYVKAALVAELPMFPFDTDFFFWNRKRAMPSPPSCQISWRINFQLGLQRK